MRFAALFFVALAANAQLPSHVHLVPGRMPPPKPVQRVKLRLDFGQPQPKVTMPLEIEIPVERCAHIRVIQPSADVDPRIFVKAGPATSNMPVVRTMPACGQ
jgi:hypothetical protein